MSDMTVGTLVAKLELDRGTYDSDIRKAGNSFQQLAQQADRASQKISTIRTPEGVLTISRDGDKITTTLKKIGTEADGTAKDVDKIGTSAKQASNDLGKTGDGMSKARKKIESDAKGAAKDVEKIGDSAKKSSDEVVTGTQKIGNAFRAQLAEMATGARDQGMEGGGSFVAGFGTKAAELGGKAGPIGAALAAAVGLGAIFGTKLGQAVADGLKIDQDRRGAAATFGWTDAQLEQAGKAAGNAYGNNFGESVKSNLSTAGVAIQAGLLNGTETAGQIEPIIEKLTTVSTIMGTEIPETARAAGQMVKTGLAGSAADALDQLTVAQQKGLNLSDDLLDTVTEYGTQYRKLGIDGATALGTISQMMSGGARDTDIAADALKEFSLRVIDGSATTQDAYKSLGLNVNDTAEAFGKGGESAKNMAATVIAKLRDIQDPVERNRIGVELFGTQWEDLGGAINKMDLSKASTELGDIGGAADRAAQQMSGPGAALETAKRKIEVAADAIKLKLAEAFGPPLQDFGNWVQTHQTEIVDFFARVGEAALTVVSAVLKIGAAVAFTGGALLDATSSFVAPFKGGLQAVEALGSAMSHLPGSAGQAGAAVRDAAKEGVAMVDSIGKMGDTATDAAGKMWQLADKVSAGKATLEDFRNAQSETADQAGVLTQALGGTANAVVAIPDGKSIILSDNTPETTGRLEALGLKVTTLPNGQVKVTADTAAASSTLDAFIQQQRVIRVPVEWTSGGTTWTGDPTSGYNDVGGSSIRMRANGAVVAAMAGGGMRMITKPQSADIYAGRGAGTVFAEQETGGEAYIPLAPTKRNRSMAILTETARLFGYGLVDTKALLAQSFADGAISGADIARMGGGTVNLSLWKAVKAHNPNAVLTSAKTDHDADGGYHPKGDAIDVDPSKANLDYLWSVRDQLAQIIYDDATHVWYNVNGERAEGAAARAIYGADTMAQHGNHIHVAALHELKDAAAQQKTAMQRTPINDITLTGDSSKDDVASKIIAEGRRRGYSDDQIKAILSTGLQESGLNPNASGGSGAWHGVFQQDSSYAGRDNPNTNITGFYDRLDAKRKADPKADIWKDIFWVQQAPGADSAESAYSTGRQGYLSEIQSQQGAAGSLLSKLSAKVGGTLAPAPTAQGPAQPTGAVQNVFVTNWPSSYDTTSSSTPTTDTTPVPSAAVSTDVVGKGPLPLVAYADGGFNPIPGSAEMLHTPRAWITLAGEAGPEAYIPTSPSKRASSIPLWIETGKRLGILRAYADGGFGGYSDDTTDWMAPKNLDDWLALGAGGFFTAASVVAPYAAMVAQAATAGEVSMSLSDLAPKPDTGNNTVAGLAEIVSQQTSAMSQQIEELKKAVREGKHVYITVKDATGLLEKSGIRLAAM